MLPNGGGRMRRSQYSRVDDFQSKANVNSFFLRTGTKKGDAEAGAASNATPDGSATVQGDEEKARSKSWFNGCYPPGGYSKSATLIWINRFAYTVHGIVFFSILAAYFAKGRPPVSTRLTKNNLFIQWGNSTVGSIGGCLAEKYYAPYNELSFRADNSTCTMSDVVKLSVIPFPQRTEFHLSISAIAMSFFALSFAFQLGVEFIGDTTPQHGAEKKPWFRHLYEEMFGTEAGGGGDTREMILCINYLRYIEYSVSASIMMLAISLVAGIYDMDLLLCIFFLTWACMICGYGSEILIRIRQVILMVPAGGVIIGVGGRRWWKRNNAVVPSAVRMAMTTMMYTDADLEPLPEEGGEEDGDKQTSLLGGSGGTRPSSSSSSNPSNSVTKPIGGGADGQMIVYQPQQLPPRRNQDSVGGPGSAGGEAVSLVVDDGSSPSPPFADSSSTTTTGSIDNKTLGTIATLALWGAVTMHLVGWVCVILPWYIIMTHNMSLWGSADKLTDCLGYAQVRIPSALPECAVRRTADPPSFVWIIMISQMFLFLLFGLVQVFQILCPGRRYEAEVAYISFSLTAKVILGSVIAFFLFV